MPLSLQCVFLFLFLFFWQYWDLNYFSGRVLSLPGLAFDLNPPTSASSVARIIGTC
jgi:hypothetical protein